MRCHAMFVPVQFTHVATVMLLNTSAGNDEFSLTYAFVPLSEMASENLPLV